jgi:hypothetical protein
MSNFLQHKWEKKFIEKFSYQDAWSHDIDVFEIIQFISNTLKEQDKETLQEIINEMYVERELTPEEKLKSVDYWEGYTKAKTEVYLIIKKYLK